MSKLGTLRKTVDACEDDLQAHLDKHEVDLCLGDFTGLSSVVLGGIIDGLTRYKDAIAALETAELEAYKKSRDK